MPRNPVYQSHDKETRAVTSWLIWPFLGLVLLHILLALPMHQPLIHADELGYLGNARYLAGAAPLPELRGCAFYHFGYSLFLLPAFALFSDPLDSYRAALVINALLAGSLVFPLAYLLEAFGLRERRVAAAAALLTCCYPAYLFFPALAMAENALVPVFAATAALLVQAVRRQSVAAGLAFGTAAGFMYAIHPRGALVTLAGAGFLCLLGWRHLLPRRSALAGLAALAATVVAAFLLNRHLKALGWGGLDGNTVAASGKLASLLTLPGLRNLVLELAGQLLYLQLATLGLLGWGAVLLVKTMGHDQYADADRAGRVGAWFLACCGLLLLGVSTVFMQATPEPGRGDVYLYGRYNETWLAPLLALALARLLTREWPARSLAKWWGAGLAATALLATVVVAGRGHQALLAMQAMSLNILAIAPLVKGWGLHLPMLVLATVAVGALALLACQWRRWGGGLVVGVAFLAVSGLNYGQFLLPAQRERARMQTMLPKLRQVKGLTAYAYDMSHFDATVYGGYQYLLPRVRLVPFVSDSSRLLIYFRPFEQAFGSRPAVWPVISGTGWQGGGAPGTQPAVRENGPDNALWLLPAGGLPGAAIK
jgi:hypothetical protein